MLQMAIFTKYCFHNSAPSQHYHPRDEPLVWVALTASFFRQKMCFGNENKLPTWQQRWSKVQLLLRILGHSSSRTSLVPVPSLPSASSSSLWAPTNPRILQLAPVQMEQSRPRSYCRARRRSGHAGTRTSQRPVPPKHTQTRTLWQVPGQAEYAWAWTLYVPERIFECQIKCQNIS